MSAEPTIVEITLDFDGLAVTLRARATLSVEPHRFSNLPDVDITREPEDLSRALLEALPAAALQAHDLLHRSLEQTRSALLREMADSLAARQRPVCI